MAKLQSLDPNTPETPVRPAAADPTAAKEEAEGAGGAACSDTAGPPGTPGGGGAGCNQIRGNGTAGPGGGGGGSNRVPAGGTSGSATGPAAVTITYEQAGGNNGGGTGSILPINLSGILPMFNNISVNNNIKSPGASNTTTQNFGLRTP
ncbi:hypothetical protein [Streptomyces aureus]|uniref:Period circadian protein n=1 Tax=Streptomyces aureus TaxID=193461 RepID=A0ABV4SY69_9ACTN